MKKKITSLLLGLTLCLSLLPAAALADDAPLYEWKSQVPEDPDAITYDIEVAVPQWTKPLFFSRFCIT